MAARPSSANTPKIQQQTDLESGEDEGGNSATKKLPAVVPGRCAFRELKSGVECGCQNFWKKRSVESSQCACGHHACYHAPTTSVKASPEQSHVIARSTDVNAALLQHLTQFGRLLSTIAPSAPTSTPSTTPAPFLIAPRLVETVPDTEQILQPGMANMAHTEQDTRLDSPIQNLQSRASTSYLPSLPLGCLLPDDMIPVPGDALNLAKPTGQELLPSPHSAGLGLWLNEVAAANRAGDVHSTPTGHCTARSESTDEVTRALRMFQVPQDESNPNIPPTREPSGNESQILPALDVTNFAALTGLEDLLQSATELATPSIGTRTPDLNIPSAIIRPTIEAGHFRAANRLSPQHMPPPKAPRSANGTTALSSMRPLMTPTSQALSPPHLARDGQSIREVANHLHALRNFMTNQNNQLRGLGDRLEAMERTSTPSHIRRDNEFLEKLEMIETRFIEVEGKVDDARANGVLQSSRSDGMVSVPKRHAQLRESTPVTTNASFQSTSSVTSSALALARDPNAIKTRLDSLDERVTDLEKSLPPSISRPLEVEVVLIPWGRELRGLWVAPGDKSNLRGASRLTTQDSEEWTNSRGLRSSSRVSASLQSAGTGGWSSEAIHDWADHADEWLVPRACGIKSVVYHRLKSRGLVKTVELHKPGAKEIQDAIIKSFGQTLIILNAQALRTDLDEAPEDELGRSFLGLDSMFIPLRKVHRSSQLQFLSKSEMLTSALWTCEFLLSSVLMHAGGGLKRLFITHKEAYLQRADSDIPWWTWQKIRELPRLGLESGRVEEADARETCWADHPILDALPLSVSTSFASHASSTSHHAQSHHQSQTNEAGHAITHEDEEMLEVKSESNSGFESEAVAAMAKPFVPITPVTECENFSTQQAYETVLAGQFAEQHWDDVLSDDEPIQAATPHPSNLQTPFYGSSSNPPRYNLRRHTRTLSNPLADSARAGQPSSRSGLASQPERRVGSGTFKRITRSFSTPSNPLIATLPTFVSSSPNASRPKPRRRGTGDSSTGHKRRRVDRSVSAEDYLTYSKARRSTSASVAPFAPQTSGGKRSKRPITPVGPYMTPYSGNFGSGYLGTNASVRSGVAGEADSEWEGVGDDEHEHDLIDRQHEAANDTMKLDTEDMMMDDEEDEEEEEDGEESNLMDEVGFA